MLKSFTTAAVLSLAFTASLAHAQDRAPEPVVELPSADASASVLLMRPDHLSISVTDLDVMIDWYGEKLGFVVEKAWTVEGLDGIRLAYLVGPAFRLELIEGGSGARSPAPRDFGEAFQTSGYQHIGFAVEDVDETMSVLKARGVDAFYPATSYPEGAERRIAFIQDPEGNLIEFSHPLHRGH